MLNTVLDRAFSGLRAKQCTLATTNQREAANKCRRPWRSDAESTVPMVLARERPVKQPW